MKKTIIYLALIALLLTYPVYNLKAISSQSMAETLGDESEGIGVLEKLEGYDLQKAERNIRKAQEKNERVGDATVGQIKETLEKIDNGTLTYRNVFKDVYIVGDSLMDGLEAYSILNSNHLITQVSASLYHLAENINRIIGMNPPVLILHYGINMIGTADYHLENFINTYEKHLRTLKGALPDTRIIVSLLFPVNRSIATAAHFGCVDKYNTALKELCAKLKIETLDSTKLLNSHKECYGGDGIHLSKKFYSDYWLRFIVEEKGIVG